MNRRRRGSLASSPLLIGAVTTLIVVVAVFLSYKANNGLPFVPTYNIKVALSEASGLQPLNQVRVAGTRVGLISSMSAHEDPATGRVTAIADLKLEKGVEPLSADTKAIVRSVSAIGLKYLELEGGSSKATLKPDATIPVSQTRESVDIDEFFDTFDKKTRTASQQNLNSFGDGLAGRGLGLNNTISTLRPLVTNAIPVLHNLASPLSDLHGLFYALDRVASQSAPVAESQARFFSDLDTFFTAFAGASHSLEAAIEGGPPSLEQAIYSLPYQARVIDNATEFMRLLRPSASALVSVAPPLGHAIAVGAVNLRAATALNTQLAGAAEALQAFGENPVVSLGLEEFTRTLQFAGPLVAGITPAQTLCNYITLAFRNVASLGSENIGIGTLDRASIVLAPNGPNNEGYPSTSFANGPSVERNTFGTAIDNNHLHNNPYPNVSGPGQPRVCEAGNESYLQGKAVIGNLPAASIGPNHELTSREQNLYGEKYPAATLKDLGIKVASKAAKR